MADSNGTDVPGIRTFQFEGNAVASVPKSVNLFRGDVNFSQTLLSLPARPERPELAVSVSILYGSNVYDAATRRNLEAPTGVLGLGWELPRESIVVDPGSVGPAAVRRYYWRSGGQTSQLVRQPPSDLAPLFTTDAITAGDLQGPGISAHVRRLFGDRGFDVSGNGSIDAADATSWILTDRDQEQLFLIERAGAAYAVRDGGESYQLQDFQFWTIAYYPVFERWQIRRESGVVSSYGGGIETTPTGIRTSRGNSVGWNVTWGAWRGNSSVTAGQEQYATAWHLCAMRNRWSDEVAYAYNGWPNVAPDIWRRDAGSGLIPMVEQTVGGPAGLPFTRATYLTEIIDVFGRTVRFSYAPKVYSNPDTDPTGPREYGDPHKPNADAPGGNAFQDPVETYYLDDITARSASGMLLTTIAFSYLPLANVTANEGLLRGDTCKRYLGNVTQYTSDGLAQPPLRFAYYLQPRDINPGALETITHPEGATATYTYVTQSLAICDRELVVAAPSAGTWIPRVFLGPDYAVSLWYDNVAGQLHLSVNSWIGRWVSWQPADGPVIYSNSLGLDPAGLQVLTNTNHFALSFPLVDQQGRHHTKLFLYNKDPRQPGQWVAAGQDQTNGIDFDTSSSTLTVVAGEGFAVVVQQSLTAPAYQLWRYTWNWHSRAWLPSGPIAGSGAASTAIVAEHDYYLLAAYTRGQPNTTLSFSFLDPLGVWHDGVPLNDPDLVVNYETGIMLDTGGSFVAASLEAQQSKTTPRYTVALYQWDDDYVLARTFLSTFTEHLAAGGRQTSIAPFVSGDAMVICSQTVLRFDGRHWWVNESLQIRQPRAGSPPAWYAPGEDFVLQTVPSISPFVAPVCRLLTFDPDTDGAEWRAKPPVAPQPPIRFRPLDSNTANFPTARGGDYFTSGSAVYARGSTPDMIDAVQQPIYTIDAPTLDTTAMIDQAPAFIAYVVPGDEPTQTTTQVLVIHNGAVAATEVLSGEKYWTPAERTSANGRYPAGLSCLVTYPSTVSGFDETSRYTLRRFAGHSVMAKLTHRAVAAVSIDDGFGQPISTAYDFDTASATCDFTGTVIKYHKSTVYAGCQVPALATQGRIESDFVNGYDAAAGSYGYMLDGLLAHTRSFDAAGALVASTHQEWAVYTVANRHPRSQDALPRVLYGGYGRLVSEATMRDGVTTKTTHEYVPDGLEAPFSGLAVGSRVDLRNAAGDEQRFATHTLYAYDVYPDLAGLQLLTPGAQATTRVSANGAPAVPVASEVTTYTAWTRTASDGTPVRVLDADRHYGWRGGAEAIFPFGSAPDARLWLMTGAVARRSALGLTTETIDADGTRNSVLLDRLGSVALAKFANASISGGEAAYCGFEPEQDASEWTIGAGAVLVGGDAHMGAWSLSLPGRGNGSLTAVFTPARQDQQYRLSCWVKTADGFQGNATSGWTLLVTAGDRPVGAPVVLPFADTAGAWTCIGATVDLRAYPGGTILTVRVSASNTTASAVLVDDVVFSPLPAQAQLSSYDIDRALLLAQTSLDGRTARILYDPYERKLGQVKPGENVTDFVVQYASRSGNGGVFNRADPNAIVSMHPRSGGSCELFQSGDAWVRRWIPTGTWSAAGGVLTHAGGDAASLTLPSAAFAPNLAFYVELVPQAPLVDDVVIDFGSGTALSWQLATSRWRLTLSGEPVSLLADPRALGRQILVITGERSLTFHVDGQLLFGATLPGASASGVTIAVGRSAIALRNLTILRDPIVEVQYHDAVSRPRQVQRLLEQDALVTQSVHDEVGRAIAATKPIPASFGTGAGAPLVAYRPGVVDVPAFLAALATSGVMRGDAADYYRGQIEPASGLPRSDDGGYPFSRRRYETSPLGRVVEIGAPGAAHAIGGARPDGTVMFSYGPAGPGDIPNLPPDATSAFSVMSARRPLASDAPGTSVMTQIVDRRTNTVLLGSASSRGSGDEILSTSVTSYGLSGRTDLQLMPNAFDAGADADHPAATIIETSDGLGRLTSRRDPNVGLTRALYDGMGRLRFSQVNQEASDPADRYITYHKYDPLGRETELGTYPYDWNDSTNADLAMLADVASWPASGASISVTRAYDGDGTTLSAIGQLTRLVRRNERDGFTIVVEEAFEYDEGGKVRRKTITISGDAQAPVSSSVGYAYDNLGRILRIDYPQAERTGLRRVCYTYDRQGRLAQVGESPDAPASIVAFAYDASGKIVAQTFGGGAIGTRSSFLSPGWPGTTNVEAPGFTAQTRSQFFDEGSLRAEHRSFAGGGLSDAYATSYTYGAHQRLIGAANAGHPEWSLAEARYDDNGNMRSVEVGGSERRYGYLPGTDQIASVQHDQFGHVKATATLTLEYEPGLGLTSGITVNGGPDLAFAYNSQGQRVVKRVAANGAIARTYYVHGQSSRPLVTIESDGTAKAFVYVPGGLLAVAAGGLYFVLRDHLGSSRYVLDSAGELAAGFDYLPFGGVARRWGPLPDLLSYLYTGQEIDVETGLFNYQARLYDPALGRFYAPDPKPDFGSPYIYAGNNPLTRIDPTGMNFFDALIGATLSAIKNFFNDKVIKTILNFVVDAGLIIAGGVIVAGLTAIGAGPAATILGSTLLGAGIGGLTYNITQLSHGGSPSWSDWGIQLGIGAATGLISGAAVAGAGAAVDAAEAGRGLLGAIGGRIGLTTDIGRITANTAAATLGNGASSFTGQLLNNLATHQALWSGVGFATLSGVALGALGAGAGEYARTTRQYTLLAHTFADNPSEYADQLPDSLKSVNAEGEVRVIAHEGQEYVPMTPMNKLTRALPGIGFTGLDATVDAIWNSAGLPQRF